MTIPPASTQQTLDISDATLVRRVLSGDPDAFEILVDRHHGRCIRVALHLLGSADDAEDVAQEALLRAYRHLGSYRERERFGAWLLRIVVNQCRTRAVREARFTPLDRLPAEAEALESDPDASLHAAWQRRQLAVALATLPIDQREAVVLRFAESLTYEEMATVTGVGVSALKMRVQRGCARLKVLLADHFSPR